jgi:hypothetical protein
MAKALTSPQDFIFYMKPNFMQTGTHFFSLLDQDGAF